MTNNELERCLCKNNDGTYDIYDALRYNAYSLDPQGDWQRLTQEYRAIIQRMSIYFLTEQPATNREGITILIDLCRKLLKN